MAECKLARANGREGVLCDGESCVYWRLTDHLGIGECDNGCAIQYFELLEGGESVAQWLLTVKQRVDGVLIDA